MGEEPGPVVVADAGPIIHLREIVRLPLLALFSVVHIPDAVWEECVGSGRVSDAELARAALIRRHAVSPGDLPEAAVIKSLHRGEIESLTLCRTMSVPLLLTDDLAARDAARSLAIQPVGSVGVVLRAFRVGRLSKEEARRSPNQLYDQSSLFVTRAIIEVALGDLDRAGS